MRFVEPSNAQIAAADQAQYLHDIERGVAFRSKTKSAEPDRNRSRQSS